MMRSRGPRSELYLRSDIANVVQAIDAANAELSVAVPGTDGAAYRAGFLAALRALVLAFDLDVQLSATTVKQERQWVGSRYVSGNILD